MERRTGWEWRTGWGVDTDIERDTDIECGTGLGTREPVWPGGTTALVQHLAVAIGPGRPA